MEPITMIDVTKMLTALSEEYEKKIASLENELEMCRAKLSSQTTAINDMPPFSTNNGVHIRHHEYATSESQLNNSAIPVEKNIGPVFSTPV